MRRLFLVTLGFVFGLPLLVAGGLLVFFDPDSLRPEAERAAARALGLPVRIEGPLDLRIALRPSLEATGIVVTGADGAPALRLERARLRLALPPLIAGRLDVAELELDRGELRLDPAAWQRAPGAPPAPAASPAAASEPLQLDLRSARMRDIRIHHGPETVLLREATVAGSGPDRPLRWDAALGWRGADIATEGQLAAPSAWTGQGPAAFRAAATVGAARLELEGERRGATTTARLRAALPELSGLSDLAGRPLPPLTDVAVEVDGGLDGATPGWRSAELRVGGGEAMGVAVRALRLHLPEPGAPATLEARLGWHGAEITLTGEAEVEALAMGQPGRVALRGELGGGVLQIEGRWPELLRLEAAFPQLEALSELAGRPLPPLRDLTARAELAPQGLQALRVTELLLASSAGDLSGALDLSWAGRPAISGALASQRLDLAALRPPASPAPAVPSPPTVPSGPARLIPDLPLDPSPWRGFDADLRLAFADLQDGALRVTDLTGQVVNRDGRLRVEPLALTLPAGRLELRLVADGQAAPPAWNLAGRGDGLDLAALLVMLGNPAPTQGRADLDLDVSGQGAGLRAVAANLSGHLGLAVTDGRLGGGIARTLSQLSPGLGAGVPVACLALRATAREGLARIGTLYLEGGPGRIAGEGTLRLADEALALRLLTDLRVAGVRVRAPVPVTGSLAQPRLEGVGLLEGALAGGGMPSLPDCATTLRAARDGRDGPVPPPAPDPAEAGPGAPRVPPQVQDLLRGFLRP